MSNIFFIVNSAYLFRIKKQRFLEPHLISFKRPLFRYLKILVNSWETKFTSYFNPQGGILCHIDTQFQSYRSRPFLKFPVPAPAQDKFRLRLRLRQPCKIWNDCRSRSRSRVKISSPAPAKNPGSGNPAKFGTTVKNTRLQVDLKKG